MPGRDENEREVTRLRTGASSRTCDPVPVLTFVKRRGILTCVLGLPPGVIAGAAPLAGTC
jgi:hypothetical protein